MSAPTAALAAKICPKPIPGLGNSISDLFGYLLTGVGLAFIGAVIMTVLTGAVGAFAHSQRMTKMAAWSGAVTIGTAIAFPILYAIVHGIWGKGCLG